MSHSSNDLTGDGRGPAELTESECHRLLAEKYRRAAVEILAELAPPIELEVLAAAIAARDNDVDEAMEHIEVVLHHTHLPKLSEFGVIEYDPRSNRVESVRHRIDALEP